MESPDNICPACKQPLPADTPLGGLCPSCLIKSGFYSGTAPQADPSGAAHGKKFMAPSAEELQPHFPHLEILELIGRGGMGAVYKARQPRLNRFVALKILARDPATDARFAERFQREAQALAQMNHPNIVGVHDFGEAGGHYYLLMEYVDGLNLRQIEHGKKLTPEAALAIVPPICDALQYAHGQGIVHRDIKPENILVDKDGRVKIADFGIAKILGNNQPDEPLTGDEQRVGTPHYMAPEQVERPTAVDHRADIYSLGVVFYEMLTGELPLGRFAPPSQKVQIDVRLDEIVLRALAKEPELRFQQASEIRTEVETLSTPAPEAQPVVGHAKPATSSGASPAAPATTHSVQWSAIPWQIWVVIGMLALEGVGNLVSIPKVPPSAGFLAAKVVMITGLLLRWRAVYILTLVLLAIHVIYFAMAQVMVPAILNLALLGLTVSAWKHYFPGSHQRDGNHRQLAQDSGIGTQAVLFGALFACFTWAACSAIFNMMEFQEGGSELRQKSMWLWSAGALSALAIAILSARGLKGSIVALFIFVSVAFGFSAWMSFPHPKDHVIRGQAQLGDVIGVPIPGAKVKITVPDSGTIPDDSQITSSTWTEQPRPGDKVIATAITDKDGSYRLAIPPQDESSGPVVPLMLTVSADNYQPNGMIVREYVPGQLHYEHLTLNRQGAPLVDDTTGTVSSADGAITLHEGRVIISQSMDQLYVIMRATNNTSQTQHVSCQLQLSEPHSKPDSNRSGVVMGSTTASTSSDSQRLHPQDESWLIWKTDLLDGNVPGSVTLAFVHGIKASSHWRIPGNAKPLFKWQANFSDQKYIDRDIQISRGAVGFN